MLEILSDNLINLKQYVNIRKRPIRRVGCDPQGSKGPSVCISIVLFFYQSLTRLASACRMFYFCRQTKDFSIKNCIHKRQNDDLSVIKNGLVLTRLNGPSSNAQKIVTISLIIFVHD